MVLEFARAELKRMLSEEVAAFYRNDDRLWKRPVAQTLHELRQASIPAVFFGGTLRSLLVSRLFANKPGRPRDVDIVVSGVSLDVLKTQFEALISRETRFGGLKLQRNNWQFDVWPLHQTWAFVNNVVPVVNFSMLPDTTFFNLEAIAVEVWPQHSKRREIFSGNEQFFDGILTKTLEINLEENPFPQLCVIRAFGMASNLDFKIGPRLAKYISTYGIDMSDEDIKSIQLKHYGYTLNTEKIIRNWIMSIARIIEAAPKTSIYLPVNKQLELWGDSSSVLNLRVHQLMLNGCDPRDLESPTYANSWDMSKSSP